MMSTLCIRGRPRHLQHGRLPALRQLLKNRCTQGRASEGNQNASTAPSLFNRLARFVDEQTLPIGLVTAICVGWIHPNPAVWAHDANVSRLVTVVIFIIAGLQIKQGEAASALQSWRAYVFGLLSILAFTPMLSKVALAMPLSPVEFAYGLAVFCCMPTSLSANIALTQAVGGNTAMSLLLTVSSNAISIFTVPFVLSLVLASSGKVSFDPVVMVINLVKTVLLPLLVGALLRTSEGVRAWVDARKKLMRNLATICLVMVPYTQVGMSKVNGAFEGVTFASGITLWLAALSLLAVIRLFNIGFVEVLGLGEEQSDPKGLRRAVVLASSQKTLPVAIAVLNQMGHVIPAVGLAAIPCVLAHLSQVLIDSVLVTWWRNQDAQHERPELA